MIWTDDFKTDVLTLRDQPDFGDKFDPAAWEGANLQYMDELLAIKGALLRDHVREAFQDSIYKGVIYSLVWGYKDGKTHGLSDPNKPDLKHVMRDPQKVVDTVTSLLGSSRSALRTVELLNEQQGLGIASTTKIAYFAGLETSLGQCLIFDRQVAKAIIKLDYPELRPVRKAITAFSKKPRSEKELIDTIAQRNASYPIYLEHAYELARLVGRGTTGDDMERLLFLRGKDLG